MSDVTTDDLSSDGEVESIEDIRRHILDYDDTQRKIVDVPEWGGIKLLMIGMNGIERAKYIRQFRNDDGTINYEAMYPSIIIACTHDPSTNERVFEETDAVAVNQKSGAALERLAIIALKLSGMDRDAEKEAGEDSSTESGGSTTS